MDSCYNLGPWACTMKLCDVQTLPGLMRKHGLIRGWAYPRDSTVLMYFVVLMATCKYEKAQFFELRRSTTRLFFFAKFGHLTRWQPKSRLGWIGKEI